MWWSGAQHVLGGQHPNRHHREVLILGLSGWRAGAEGVPLPAEGAGVQLDDALPAEPVLCLGAAAAKVLPRPEGKHTLHGCPSGWGASPSGILR